MKKELKRNWLDLPSDVMSNILHRIGVIDILNAQKVCSTWCKLWKDPSLWRVIYMNNESLDPNARPRLREMCKHAVDRSQGQLVDITIVDFADACLLQYVADRSSHLRRLEFACCEDIYGGWTKALKQLPLLEELSLHLTWMPITCFETIAHYCPMLRTLKVNEDPSGLWQDGANSWGCLLVDDDTAIIIGEKLPELRHLELIRNNMSQFGLLKILDGCRHLESLDLRGCYYINFEEEDVGEECLEKIKCLKVKLPEDSLEGYPYIKGE